jgi:hypothetical protein
MIMTNDRLRQNPGSFNHRHLRCRLVCEENGGPELRQGSSVPQTQRTRPLEASPNVVRLKEHASTPFPHGPASFPRSSTIMIVIAIYI